MGPFRITTLFCAISCGASFAQVDAGSRKLAWKSEASSAKAQVDGLIRAARGGDQDAQAELRSFAERGDAVAQNAVGLLSDDLAEATKWYRLAALQGFPVAQANLSQCYLTPDPAQRDLRQGLMWLTASAEQGLWLSQGNLANLYRGQNGVVPDYVQSYKWYTIAARVLSEQVRYDIEKDVLRKRDHVAARMTAAQVEEAETLAQAWTRKDWRELRARLPERK